MDSIERLKPPDVESLLGIDQKATIVSIVLQIDTKRFFNEWQHDGFMQVATLGELVVVPEGENLNGKVDKIVDNFVSHRWSDWESDYKQQAKKLERIFNRPLIINYETFVGFMFDMVRKYWGKDERGPARWQGIRETHEAYGEEMLGRLIADYAQQSSLIQQNLELRQNTDRLLEMLDSKSETDKTLAAMQAQLDGALEENGSLQETIKKLQGTIAGMMDANHEDLQHGDLEIDSHEVNGDIENTLATLTNIEAQVLNLALEGKDATFIAQNIGKTEPQADCLYRSAINKLRIYLEEMLEDQAFRSKSIHTKKIA